MHTSNLLVILHGLEYISIIYADPIEGKMLLAVGDDHHKWFDAKLKVPVVTQLHHFYH